MSDHNGKCMGTIKDNKKAENLFQILGFVFSIRLPLFLLPRERGNSVPWL